MRTSIRIARRTIWCETMAIRVMKELIWTIIQMQMIIHWILRRLRNRSALKWGNIIEGGAESFMLASLASAGSVYIWESSFNDVIFSIPHSQNSPFGPNHPLSMFMQVPNLQNLHHLQNLPHTDVLEKLKMQVGLMDPEFSLSSLASTSNGAFSIPQNTSAALISPQNGFPFIPPNAPHTKDGKFCLVSNSLLYMVGTVIACPWWRRAKGVSDCVKWLAMGSVYKCVIRNRWRE